MLGRHRHVEIAFIWSVCASKHEARLHCPILTWSNNGFRIFERNLLAYKKSLPASGTFTFETPQVPL